MNLSIGKWIARSDRCEDETCMSDRKTCQKSRESSKFKNETVTSLMRPENEIENQQRNA